MASYDETTCEYYWPGGKCKHPNRGSSCDGKCSDYK